MNVLMRSVGRSFLTAAAVFGVTAAEVGAQVPNPGLGQAAAIGGLGNAAVLGGGLVQSPFSGGGPLNFGMNYGPISTAGGLGSMASPMGYGSLAASYAGSPLGYGSLAGGYGLIGGALTGASLGYGAGYGYGLGIGTQWMMNPYQGYLQGAASITKENAKYQLTVSQAKIVRQQAVQERYRTRRAMMEQAEWEMAHRPDPEKIRQAALQREIDRARLDPPSTEIWSGRSLNALLRTLIARQGQGMRGPNVTLDQDMLKSINPTSGNTRGNVGLLKDEGKLVWPQPLQKEIFKDAREDLSRRMNQAARTVRVNQNPDESTVNDLQADLKHLQQILDAHASTLSPDEFTEAQRYVRMLKGTIAALRDRNVVNLFNGAWSLKGKNVAELVQFMRDKGLWFAPASPGDEPAYTALHHALVDFDNGLPRVARTSDNRDNPPRANAENTGATRAP